MKLSQRGLDFIKSWEGFSSVAYTCSGGKLTIGYGHVLPDNTDINTIERINEKEAEDLLEKDVEWAERAINGQREIIEYVGQDQFDALVSFVFNLGSYNFLKSKFYQKLIVLTRIEGCDDDAIDKHESAKYDAMWEMIEFIHASENPMLGLSRRRAAESWMFLTGHYHNNS